MARSTSSKGLSAAAGAEVPSYYDLRFKDFASKARTWQGKVLKIKLQRASARPFIPLAFSANKMAEMDDNDKLAFKDDKLAGEAAEIRS